MRINVYHEELTDDFEYVEKYVEETGRTYYGFRMFMESSPKLHFNAKDDDRSAITLWFGTKRSAVEYMRNVFNATVSSYGKDYLSE